MKAIEKIVLISFLSLIILVGGSYLYISQLKKLKEFYASDTSSEFYFQQKEVIPSVNLNTTKSYSSQRERNHSNRSVQPEMMVDNLTEITSNRILSETTNRNEYTSRSIVSVRKPKKDESLHSTSGSTVTGLLAHGGRSGASSSAGTGSSGGGINSISPLSTATMTPFSVPKNTNSIILVDPTTDPLETERIPAGDGLWILLLMAVGYGRRRKKKPL